jgi:hypothetical protein
MNWAAFSGRCYLKTEIYIRGYGVHLLLAEM